MMKIAVLDRESMGLDISFDALSSFGDVVIYDRTGPSDITDKIADADIVLINKVRMTKEVFAAAKKLKLVCEFATGYDNIDLAAAREGGVAITNVPGYSTESVTLFTVSTALALVAHLPEYGAFVKSGAYSESGVPNRLTPTYHEIAGKTWGIFGYGTIGKRVGTVAEALGCRVIACKRSPSDDPRICNFRTLLRESDILSVHCPLTPETRGIFDARALSEMKKTAVLVNEARGAVLDEKAVAEAIKAGKIGALGVDVYGCEPFGTDHPYYGIKDLPNVLLTPHAAWGAIEARQRCLAIIVSNIESFFAGQRKNRVD